MLVLELHKYTDKKKSIISVLRCFFIYNEKIYIKIKMKKKIGLIYFWLEDLFIKTYITRNNLIFSYKNFEYISYTNQ